MTPAVSLPACPLCAAAGIEQFRAHGYPVLDCASCGHRYAGLRPAADHVDTVYDSGYFSGGAAGYADYLSEGTLLRAHGRRYGRRLARFSGAGHMLDIGAACGFLLQGFAETGWTGVGIEPNPAMAALGRDRYGMDLRVGTAESLDPGGPAARALMPDGEPPFDLVSMIQVLAHLHEPRRALENLARLTRPGGWWLIETWDWTSLTARLSGQRWHEYSPPSVLHWFSRRRLEQWVREFGFEPVAHGRPAKWLRADHAKSLLRYKLEGSLIGRVALPLISWIPNHSRIPYPAEDLFWLLCRRSR